MDDPYLGLTGRFGLELPNITRRGDRTTTVTWTRYSGESQQILSPVRNDPSNQQPGLPVHGPCPPSIFESTACTPPESEYVL